MELMNSDKQSIKLNSYDELIAQLKILLDNNYAVAICKNNELLADDVVSYEIAYKEKH